MRIVSIVGLKNAGKTTLLVALAREFHRRGKRVATIKHAAAEPEADKDGSDAWRHFHEGMADGVLVAGPSIRVTIERQADNRDPVALARQHFARCDLVMVEGFAETAIPKIEIYRTAVGKAPLVSAAADKTPWLAVLSDTAVTGVTCPVLKFNDTMWLQLLATLAWDRAQVIDG